MSTATNAPHLPVMPTEVLAGLQAPRGAWVIDGTFGAGGHTKLLLAEGVNVIGIDQDPNVAPFTRVAGDGEFRFAAGNFRDMETLALQHDIRHVHGVLLDLGVSSMQLDEQDRGFSFRHDGPLDMRMSASGQSAADLVNESSFEELAALIWRYGEDRFSRRIARKIIAAREEQPITTTGQLANVIASAYPGGPRRDHPARRTFQALRIALNDELGALQEGLEAAARMLLPGGRLVILSYHSGEDRIAKHFIQDSPRLVTITKKPAVATAAEIEHNPRARSAKMRVAERVADRD